MLMYFFQRARKQAAAQEPSLLTHSPTQASYPAFVGLIFLVCQTSRIILLYFDMALFSPRFQIACQQQACMHEHSLKMRY